MHQVQKAGSYRSRLIKFGLIAAVISLSGAGVASAVTAPPSIGLLASSNATLTSPVRLSHSTAAPGTHIFLGGAGGSSIASVAYFLDDANGASTPIASQTTAPFETGALPALTPGVHWILAVVTTTAGGGTHDLFARFVVR